VTAEISIGAKVAMWRSLMEVHAAVLRTLEAELEAKHQLSVNEFDALVNIPSEGLRHRELTARVILSQSALSRLLDRLEERGLIERSGAASDGRGTQVRLTTAGRRLKAHAVRTNAEVVDREFSSHLDARELDQLRAILAHFDGLTPAPE
jgi:DNA-binding MarR family transcriptional regulator